MKPIIWSYGGGKQSVAIGVLIAAGKLPRPERAVIADTGREATSTWEYLEKYMQPRLNTVGLKVEIIPHSLALNDLYDGKGRVLVPAFTKGGIGQMRTFCSGEWKRDVTLRYLRSLNYGPKNPIRQWIGFSLDEIGRCKPSKRKWVEIEWPLILGYGFTIKRESCVSLILESGLPEPKKSRCKICPFMSNQEWKDQELSYPADHLYAINLDKAITSKDGRGGAFLHRSGVPLADADLSAPDPAEHPLFGRGEDCKAGVCWT